MLWSVTLTHRLLWDGGHALTVPRVYTIFVHVQGNSQVRTPSLCTCKVTARCVHHLCARARLQPGVYTPSLCTCKVTARCVHHLCACARLQPGVYTIFVHVQVTARCVPHLCACAGYSQVCTPSLCTCKVTARGVQCSGR